MKVWIDQDLCTADGLCEEIAPDVFVMDLEGLTDGTFPPQPAKLGPLATGVPKLVSMLHAPQDLPPNRESADEAGPGTAHGSCARGAESGLGRCGQVASTHEVVISTCSWSKPISAQPTTQ